MDEFLDLVVDLYIAMLSECYIEEQIASAKSNDSPRRPKLLAAIFPKQLHTFKYQGSGSNKNSRTNVRCTNTSAFPHRVLHGFGVRGLKLSRTGI